VAEFEKEYMQGLLRTYREHHEAAAAAKKNRRAFWELMRISYRCRELQVTGPVNPGYKTLRKDKSVQPTISLIFRTLSRLHRKSLDYKPPSAVVEFVFDSSKFDPPEMSLPLAVDFAEKKKAQWHSAFRLPERHAGCSYSFL